MPHPTTLPILMALTVAGAGLGLYFGKSAIGEINPAYYSSPEPGSRFHADLVPNAPDFSAPELAPQDVSFAGLGSGCVRCRDYSDGDAPAPAQAVEGYSATYAAYDPVPAADIIDDVEREIEEIAARSARRAAVRQDVLRYAHYPVSAEEVRVAYGDTARAEATPSQSENGCAPGATCAGAPTPGI